MNKKKYFFNILSILIFGGLAIYFSIRSDYEYVFKALLEVKLNWLLIGLIIMIFIYCIDGLILYIFGQLFNKAYRYKQALINALSGVFWCGITPFSSGGQFAQVYIFNKQGIVPSFSASILLLSFIIYQTVLVLFSALILIFRFTDYQVIYPNLIYLSLIGFLVNFSVIIGLFLGSKNKLFQNFICNNILKLLSGLKLIKNYYDSRDRLIIKLQEFRKELDYLQKNKVLIIKIVVLNIIRLTLLYSIPFILSYAMDIPISFEKLFDIISISSILYLITAFIPIPGASGGSEGVFVLLFGHVFGVATTSTLLVWRFITYYLGLFLGGICFATNKEINYKEN